MATETIAIERREPSDGTRSLRGKQVEKEKQREVDTAPNNQFHRIAALWHEGVNLKGCGWVARGARGR